MSGRASHPVLPWLGTAVATVLLHGAVVAQGGGGRPGIAPRTSTTFDETPSDAHRLDAIRTRLAAAVRREQRLLDARIHHDLGLPVDDACLHVTEAHRRLAVSEDAANELAELQAALAIQGREWSELRQRVQSARDRAARGGWTEQAFADQGVPTATELQQLFARAAEQKRADLAAEESERQAALDAEGDGEAEAADETGGGSSESMTVAIDRAEQVSAPADLGHALLRVGLLQQRRAQAAEREAVAADDADRQQAATARLAAARVDLERARDILTQSVAAGTAAKRDRFALARCHEKLGDVVHAEQIFRDLIAEGFVENEDGSRSMDSWARAATTSLAVMRWKLESGDWRPRHDPRKVDLERLR